MKNYSGYCDKNKNPINEGDIVIFYFDADHGHGTKNDNYSEMIDICWQDKNTGIFYLMSDIGYGSFVYWHNDYCEVIGNIKHNKDLIKNFSDDYLKRLFP